MNCDGWNGRPSEGRVEYDLKGCAEAPWAVSMVGFGCARILPESTAARLRDAMDKVGYFCLAYPLEKEERSREGFLAHLEAMGCERAKVVFHEDGGLDPLVEYFLKKGEGME